MKKESMKDNKKSIFDFQHSHTIITKDNYRIFNLLLEQPKLKEQYDKLIEQVEDEYENIILLNTFKELSEDVFYSYYNKHLEARPGEKIKLRFLFNYAIITNLIKTETHDEFRNKSYSTIQNHTASFHAFYIAIIEILKKLDEYLKEPQKKELACLDQEINNHETLKELAQDKQSGEFDENTDNADEVILRDKIKKYLTENNETIEKAVEDGVTEAKKQDSETQNLMNVLGGFQQGHEQGKLQKLPVHKRIELAKKLSHAVKLREIVAYLGRFRIIAQKKQVTKKSNIKKIGVSGLTLGDDLSKLTTSEVANIVGDEAGKIDFYDRLERKQLQMIEPDPVVITENLGKGSVIICVDTSGSMSGIPEYKSKALALAVAEVAYQEGRNFACILFSYSRNELLVLEINPKDEIDIIGDKVIGIAENFYGGGTDFELPLEKAINIINMDEFNNADILFLTDGYADVSDKFLEQYKTLKKEKQFKTIGLLLDASDAERSIGKKALEKFCDDIIFNSSIEKDKEFLNSDNVAEKVFSSLLL